MTHLQPVAFLLSLAAFAAALGAQTRASRQDPAPAGDVPPQARAFEPFREKVKLRWDPLRLYLESNGMPDHEMMTGIRAWQQQVPLPQPYTGDNAWQWPRKPVPAADPKSARTGFFRGAIAIAVNGVPIFNPIKNDGKTDTFVAGELDLFGGHAGRADDYHYHIAPVHLNEGDPSRPIAYALDGYPIYGYDEPDGSPVRALDELNGHDDPKIGYHYHATRTYPYLNGGFHGEVDEAGGQVDPQPHAHGVRPATTPLRGAIIESFEKGKDGRSYTLTYDLRGKKGTVAYTIREDGSVHFVFTTPDGAKREETHRPEGQARGGGGGGRRRDTEAPRRDPQPEPQPQDPPRRGGQAGPGPATAPGSQPWVAAHFAELDTDKDGTVTTAELEAECTRTLEGLDRDGNGIVSAAERDGRGGGRSAMGGFVRQHWGEVDADGDDMVSAAEIRRTARSMFERADRDADGNLTRAEAETPRTEAARGNAGNPQGGTQPAGGNQGVRNRQGGGGRGYAALEVPFHTDVPWRNHDLLLVQPTATTITLSVLPHRELEAYVEFGTPGAPERNRTPVRVLKAGEPVSFELTGLAPSAPHAYRFRHRPAGEADATFAADGPHVFHTQRAPGSAFTFTVIADSHLDTPVSTEVYAQTLQNALAARPDFHVDLGDTFMTDKRRDFREAEPHYLAQRYWLGQLCTSAPLFLALGNHDGEAGYSGSRPDQVAGWSYAMRTRLFPPPVTSSAPGAMYTGRTGWRDGKGANHFAFEWGDALVCVLDPFWATTERARGGGTSELELTDASWNMTLGREQYDWLARTLASSKAPWKFVFTHHLVGGRGRVARGGAESAPYFEWGGANADGSPGFAQRRPGWPKPVHQLLVEHGVAAVFHGHDHLFVHNELDGVVYQCIAQPGNARGNTRTATEYGYEGGTVLGSPGHLRVSVAPGEARIAFVRSLVGEPSGRDRAGAEGNGSVVHEYALAPRRTR